MKKRIFLIGPEACGKTSLISGAVGSEIRRAGGLVLRHMGGGLEIFSPAEWERRRFAGPGPELSAHCSGLLARASSAPFAVIDGLGGAELEEAELYEALVRFLFSGTPCAGALEPPAGEEGALLRELLTSDPDTMLLETSGRYDVNAEGALRHWAEEYVFAPASTISW